MDLEDDDVKREMEELALAEPEPPEEYCGSGEELDADEPVWDPSPYDAEAEPEDLAEMELVLSETSEDDPQNETDEYTWIEEEERRSEADYARRLEEARRQQEERQK